MNYRIVVSAVIHKEGQILLGKRKPGVAPYPDTWQIPGGGVNLGQETTEEAVQREVLEETGLRIKNLKKFDWDTDIEKNKHGVDTYYIFLTYTCDYESGELAAMDDMAHFEWVPKERIKQLELCRPSIVLFGKLGYI